jgi:anti-anti-sigma regulatory factor
MTTVAEYYKIDGEHVEQSLNPVREKLGTDSGEVVLDFSSVLRIDTNGLHAIEELSVAAEKLPAKIVFRGVHVSIYKVLKLARLTSRFSFAN